MRFTYLNIHAWSDVTGGVAAQTNFNQACEWVAVQQVCRVGVAMAGQEATVSRHTDTNAHTHRPATVHLPYDNIALRHDIKKTHKHTH